MMVAFGLYSFCMLAICFGSVSANLNITLAALITCKEISSKISSASEVVYPGNPDYVTAIEHWFLSSTQVSACVLNAGSAEDISTAIQIIGRDKTPFAVKSGGHATNPGFSSTLGVHIYPGRINQVTVSADGSTASVGLGQEWVDVYEKLQGTGLGVNGGRVPGPGVGGFVLGGGYTWKTNQYGMTVDTIKSYTLVLPNGTITTVDSSTPDLFFALKGGFNKFGIVSSVEMYTHPQGEVYAGYNVYSGDKITALTSAIAKFDSQNTDPKAQMILTLAAGATPAAAFAEVFFFYDGPTKPAIFSLFDNITPLSSNVKTQTFYSFVSSIPSKDDPNLFGRFGVVSVTALTPGFMNLLQQELNLAGQQIVAHGGGPFPPSYEVDPFLKYGKYATDSAYPHADSPKPVNLYFSWLSPTEDSFWIEYMEGSQARLNSYAQANGISNPLYYGNYALANTTATQLYGATNAARLAAIRAQVDPNGIMNLCGGFDV